MSATLDTNLVLRLVMGDIPDQYETVRDLLAVPGARYRVTDMAIAEIVHALVHHYGLTRPQVAEILHAIITAPNIDTNRGLLEAVIDSFIRHPGLSFVDCYLAEEARAWGNLPLLTFDKKLAHLHNAAQLLRAST